MAEPALTITDHPERMRFEASLGHQLAGFVDYRLVGTRRVVLHTEVPEQFAGRGIGAAMASHILEAARASGDRVTVHCPFIRAWLDRHPEYADLVTPLPGHGHEG